MCGIVGLIAKGNTGLISQQENCFKELLYVDALRGLDSTGVVGVNKHGDFGWMKEAAEAAIFLPKLTTSDLWKEMWQQGQVWIGHNRKKTVGDIADETAHPFIINNEFAVVHNGTLNTYKYLHEEAKTDSEALANVLYKAFRDKNPKEALELVLGDVYGAYALAMFDQKEMKVHLLRNKERPLWRIETENAFYFASEPNMATMVLTRNNYIYSKLEIKCLEDHVLYTYDLNKKNWTEEKLTPKKSTVASSSPTKATKEENGGTGIGNYFQRGQAVDASNIKYIRRQLIGTVVTFWVDDFYEQNIPLTLDSGETEVVLFGMCDDIKWSHQLSGFTDMAAYAFSTKEDIFDNKWQGKISSIDLAKAGGVIYINLEDVKPLPKTIGTRDFFKKQVFSKSLVMLKRELRENEYKLTDWQHEVYQEAIKHKEEEIRLCEQILEKEKKDDGKVRFEVMKAALEAAKKEGKEVAFKVVGKQHIWYNKLDSTEVIYESPATNIH